MIQQKLSGAFRHNFHVETLSNCPREEKSDLEMEYEARLREMDEKHQHELQELENAYQQKIMGEVERYQVITALV